jgi:hypothetical protein
VLTRFLHTPRMRRAALERVARLADWFATQREYAFYGSSLLLCYDAACGAEAELRLAMIDFAHVHRPRREVAAPDSAGGRSAGAVDASYLFGVNSLRTILTSIAGSDGSVAVMR